MSAGRRTARVRGSRITSTIRTPRAPRGGFRPACMWAASRCTGVACRRAIRPRISACARCTAWVATGRSATTTSIRSIRRRKSGWAWLASRGRSPSIRAASRIRCRRCQSITISRSCSSGPRRPALPRGARRARRTPWRKTGVVSVSGAIRAIPSAPLAPSTLPTSRGTR